MPDDECAAARAIAPVYATAILILLAGSATASIPTPPPATCIAPFPSPGAVCCFACPATHTCVTARGGTGCFDVAAEPECCWSAVASSGFGLTLTGATQGCGNGQECYEREHGARRDDGGALPLAALPSQRAHNRIDRCVEP